jgi:Zn-dependent peptidase ImmA (M78 family)
VATRVDINSDILIWAIARAGYSLPDFEIKLPKITSWIKGDKQPTVKQLEDFSRKVHVPFGYLFLSEPPQEKLPIPFFRTLNGGNKELNINVYDTIILLQQRQEWLKSYLQDNEFDMLEFVGSHSETTDPKQISDSIRTELGFEESWASNYKNWTESLSALVEKIEDRGIIVNFNGVVENSNNRNIPVEECRGFVLVDEYAPFMFINNADWKTAQMFTIVHELAHIWIGQSAGFDFRQLQPADDPIEILCDKVAAEFLVPEILFQAQWKRHPSTSALARYFKVSEIVIARRALDTGVISKQAFFTFYNEYSQREFIKSQGKGSGGDFYATTRKRLSVIYASHVKNAVNSGQLNFRDASKLTSLKGDTLNTFFQKHI